MEVQRLRDLLKTFTSWTDAGEEAGLPWSLYFTQRELSYKTFLPVLPRKDEFSLRCQSHSMTGVSKEYGNPSQVVQMIQGLKTVQNSGGREGGRQKESVSCYVGYRMSLIDHDQGTGSDGQGLASDSGVWRSHEARVEIDGQEPDL